MNVAQDPKGAIRSVAGGPRPGRSRVDQNGNDRRERVFSRLSSEEKQRAEYWAQKRGFASVNEYVAEAVAEKIRRESLDFDIPDILTARINQLIDEVKANSTNTANLERVVTMGFDSLIGLTRGDNYLLDDENGELS